MDTVRTDSPIVIAPGPDLPVERGVVFLPFVVNERPKLTVAEQFFNLLWGDARQLRKRLIVCPSLSIAAGQRAQGLADGGPWAHVDANGITPNEYARAAGCKLPDHYARKGNGIESLVAGSADAFVLFNALANSPAHAAHLFGRLPHYLKQDKCGLGFAAGGRFSWYMCVMIGECIDG
jgi:hypothetical protein